MARWPVGFGDGRGFNSCAEDADRVAKGEPDQNQPGPSLQGDNDGVGRVDPVGVLEHHQHRPLPRLGFELVEHCLEQLFPLAPRAEVELGRSIRQRQQLA